MQETIAELWPEVRSDESARAMEAIAEGLWVLSEKYEKRGCIAQAVKCLEAICQSHVSFLPIVEVKTRLRIATLLLHHADNVTHAKTHLERAVILLFSNLTGFLFLRCCQVPILMSNSAPNRKLIISYMPGLISSVSSYHFLWFHVVTSWRELSLLFVAVYFSRFI